MRTLVATVAATVVATTLGSAGYALAATDGTTTSVIAVIGTHGSDKTIGVKPKGFSIGDQDVASTGLNRNGSPYGHFDGICEVTSASKSKANELCTETFSLPDGLISATGTVSSGPKGPSPFDWAITGGTGIYAGATGFVHVVPSNTPKIHMTIHVTY
jgi:hypothetical protein